MSQEGKQMKGDQAALILGSILFGALLLSDPHCKRGCRTVAQHLIEHGLDEFLTTLFS
jgi:hypothetical protein